MGHPMESWLDERDEERGRRWERRDAVEGKIARLPLSAFTASQFPDLALLYDRGAVSGRWSELESALERLEAFLDARAKKRAPQRAKPTTRRR